MLCCAVPCCAGKDENREAYDAVINSGLTFIDTAEVSRAAMQQNCQQDLGG
jgi:hypothetical protein